jgi:hypothetical protein
MNEQAEKTRADDMVSRDRHKSDRVPPASSQMAVTLTPNQYMPRRRGELIERGPDCKDKEMMNFLCASIGAHIPEEGN